jgi:predicted NBD/HSP70 family sugar kinase
LQPKPAELLAAAIPQFQTDPRNPATQNLPKQLRKALQNGSQSARAAVEAGARQAGLLVAQTINALQPDALAIDGAAIYELKRWVWPVILGEIQTRVPAPLREQVPLTICHLGKDAGITGAAMLAAAKA